MSSVTRPLGPLPARVYWTRRLILLALVFVLVFGVARLLGGGGGNGPSARPVAAGASSTPTSSKSPTTSPSTPVATAPTVSSSPTATNSVGAAAKKATASPSGTALPAPSGPCSVNDLVVTPAIKNQAHAGKPVTFEMQLKTKSTPACTFRAGADAMVVKITSGSDRIWSTQDCPKAIPTRSVVVRKDTPATVDVTWNGMRSDSTCSRATSWAQPGYYHAMAAVYGADPVDAQFVLMKPVRPTVTAKPSPHASPKGGGNEATGLPPSGKTPSSKPTSRATASPSH
jgi:hypothetical protein